MRVQQYIKILCYQTFFVWGIIVFYSSNVIAAVNVGNFDLYTSVFNIISRSFWVSNASQPQIQFDIKSVEQKIYPETISTYFTSDKPQEWSISFANPFYLNFDEQNQLLKTNSFLDFFETWDAYPSYIYSNMPKLPSFLPIANAEEIHTSEPDFISLEGIRRTSNEIDILHDDISQQLMMHPTAIRVLLLGETRIGKSTFGNALIGRNLAVKTMRDKCLLDVEEKEPYFKQSSVALSNTTIPKGIFVDDLVVWDLPGFFDNRNHEQQIINAYAIDKLLDNLMLTNMLERYPAKIKCILLLKERKDLIDDFSYGKLTDVLKIITNMFPDESTLKDGLSIVVSHHESSITVHQRLNYVLEDMMGVLKSYKIGSSEYIQYSKYTNLLSHLLEKKDEKGNLMGIYSFPICKTGEIYEFSDRTSIIQHMKINPVRKPKHKITFSPEIQLQVGKILVEKVELTEMLKPIMLKINEIYDVANDAEREVWKEFFENIQETTVKSEKEKNKDNRRNIERSIIYKFRGQISKIPNFNSHLILNQIEECQEYIAFANFVAPKLELNAEIPSIMIEFNRLSSIFLKYISELESKKNEAQSNFNSKMNEWETEIENDKAKVKDPTFWETAYDVLRGAASKTKEVLLTLGSETIRIVKSIPWDDIIQVAVTIGSAMKEHAQYCISNPDANVCDVPWL